MDYVFRNGANRVGRRFGFLSEGSRMVGLAVVIGLSVSVIVFVVLDTLTEDTKRRRARGSQFAHARRKGLSHD